MEEYIKILFTVLIIALIAAIISTNAIQGIKNAVAIDNKWINRIITLFINVLISYWFYFAVMLYTDIITYVVVLILTCSGAETIYNIVGQLQDAKSELTKQQLIDESKQL